VKRLLLILLLLPVFSYAQIINLVAGNGGGGYLGDGGPATAAEMNAPTGVATRNGNVYIADHQGSRIRKVDASGIMSTIAGNGTTGYSGDGAAATAAILNQPTGVAVDTAGNIYFVDEFNDVVRKINTSGIITTIAGGAGSGYTGDGGPATNASFSLPYSVAVDHLGNIYIADQGNNAVRKVNTLGVISTVAGTGYSGYTGDGGIATIAKLSLPNAVAVDTSGNLFIADRANNVIRKVNPAGIISTIAGIGTPGYTGDGGPATAASLNWPQGLAINAIGALYISDRNNNVVRKINLAGIISTVAGTGVAGYSGDGAAATAADLNMPIGIAVDSCENVFVTDAANNRIRKIVFDPGCLIGYLQADEIEKEHTMTAIYPNPATMKLTVSSPGKINQISITTLLGQIVYAHSCDTEKAEVDVANLPAGVYLVKINGTEVRKFIKE